MASVRVKVRSILTIKKILDRGELEFSIPQTSTLERLLEAMANTWGDEFASHLFNRNGESILPHIRLIINGQDIAFLNGLETVLHDGDEILIIPPGAGG